MDLDTIIGLAMIVLGALVFLGEFSVSWLLPVAGVVLVVMGVLMLLGVLAGSTLMGISILVIGLLLYGDVVGIPNAITQILNTVVGIVLIVLGILQLT
ncbi:hypothetical protein BRD56_00745 [Thermoplasmatales archaeon SW_10_69_26]|nr:MAG: hypothetical protein BRD56_00745 [Thermoplasmatales archaeon SW_10_69_26]